MARTDTAVHLADARTDLVSALADVDGGDSVYNMIKDLTERLDFVIVKCQNP